LVAIPEGSSGGDVDPVDTCDLTPLPVHWLGYRLISAPEYSDIYGEDVPEVRVNSLKTGLLISFPLSANSKPIIAPQLFQLPNQTSPVLIPTNLVNN